MADLTIKPSRGIQGALTLPGDKSMSHRSVIFAAIAEGDTLINGFRLPVSGFQFSVSG